MSSTVIAKNIQIGADGTASNNFTIFQPASPDGTLRIGNGNTGITASLVALTSAGNVGIGTSAPGVSRLNVQGTQSATLGTTAQFTLSSGQGFYLNSETGNINRIAVGTGETMAFNIGSTERMRIDSSGNLLVGTTATTSNARLAVTTSSTSNLDYGIYAKNSGGAFLLGIDNNGGFSTGTAAGSPYNATTATAANTVVDSAGALKRSTSSIKYKTDVRDATHGLVDLLKLRSVTYKGKNDGDTIFGGLIAEEVDAAGLTEFVQYAEDGTPDALAYGNMVSLCIKAIQEQQAIITALTARVTALEGAQP